MAAELQYKTRKSPRAKYLRANIDHVGEVELVVPRRMSLAEAHYWMQQNLDWIKQRRQQILEQRVVVAEADRTLPSQIPLQLLNQNICVDYDISSDSKHSRAVFDFNKKQLTVKCYDSKRAIQSLEAWLLSLAKKILLVRLDTLSQQYQLNYKKGFVRRQKTRWGSCTTDHRIFLNRNLLFLPQPQVDYLITHELCHTVHFNHSKYFWQLVEQFQPDYRNLDKSLNKASNQIPLWALR